MVKSFCDEKSIGAFYDAWSEEYSHSMDSPIPSYHRSIFQELVGGFIGSSFRRLRVLDIGSGDGRDLCDLTAKYANIIEAIGVDVSIRQIQRAKQRCGMIPGGRVWFVHKDAINFLSDHLYSRSLPFDLIISNFGVFNFFEGQKLKTLLRLAGEALSVDGLLLFSALNKHSFPEKIYFLLNGRWADLNRRHRLTHSGHNGTKVNLRYYSSNELLGIIKSVPLLSDGTRLFPIRKVSTGLLVPPPFVRMPRPLLSILIRADRSLVPLSRFLPFGEFVLFALAKTHR